LKPKFPSGVPALPCLVEKSTNMLNVKIISGK
jgi:hypothetical protein